MTRLATFTLNLSFVVATWTSYVTSVQGQQAASKIGPPDVFVRVGLVRDELELIRFAMGQPKNEQPEFGVKGAAPREVYFQTLTLFRKSERLSFEHTREHSVEPVLPKGDIEPADVYEVVDAALERVRSVKRKLGIKKQSAPAKPDPTKTPNDVFRSAVQANRQINILLERRFGPSDVFQQVTLGVGYASRLLESFPDAETIPKAPAFEAGKRPGDVYQRLLGCVERIRRIAHASNFQVLELNAEEADFAQAEPSDVYDVASLLVSELDFLHSHLDGARPPREVYYVGRKFPSHVYQRVGILEQQLIQLEERVVKKPDWLGVGDSPK